MCWGKLLCDAGSLMQCVKPRVIFEGSRTEKQLMATIEKDQN